MDTKATVKGVLVKLLSVKPEEISDDAPLVHGIGVDSTEMVEFVIALEKAFSTKLSPKEITKNSTVNEIVKNIEGKLAAK